MNRFSSALFTIRRPVHEFYQLGLGEVYSISSINGSGTGELLDEVVKDLKVSEHEDIPDLPKYTVVGRPNVGKSSLINALIGEERNIVTPVPGTTRDSIYIPFNSFGFDFLLVDTAGLRKKGKVHEDIEFYSVMRSIRAIENSDVCLLMIDAQHGIEAQDLNILHLIERNHKGVVIVVNKWDLVDKSTNTHKEFEIKIREKIAPFNDIPIIFTSVTEKLRIIKALELAGKVHENRSRKISTSQLNSALLPIIQDTPPPAVRGSYIRIKYITQLPTPFPSFAFFSNYPQHVKDPYKRFLENRMREMYDFSGVPITIFLRKK